MLCGVFGGYWIFVQYIEITDTLHGVKTVQDDPAPELFTEPITANLSVVAYCPSGPRWS